MPEMPMIDPERCDRCGLCISVCSCGAIVMVDNIVTITDADSCGWCTMCEIVCPNDAIVCAYEIIDEQA